MNSPRITIIIGWWLLTAVAGMCLSDAEPSDHSYNAFTRHWWERLKPAETNVIAQLDYANELRKSGRTKRAARAYRALVYNWPDSKKSPIAQFNYADCLKHMGKHKEAFDAYQFLVEVYAGFFSQEKVIARQSDIADHLATRKKRFLFFSYTTPHDAIPFFQQLLQNYPIRDEIQNTQYRIGKIHHDAGEYQKAIQAYQKYLNLNPFGAMAEQASYGRATCYYKLAEKNLNDRSLRERARASLEYHIMRHQKSDADDKIRIYLQELLNAQASAYYNEAAMYEKFAGHTRDEHQINTLLTASAIVYERLINEFPDSSWAQTAMTRIYAIDRQPEKQP